MANLFKAFLGLLLSVILLTGCSKSDDKPADDAAVKPGSSTVTKAPDGKGEQAGQLTPASVRILIYPISMRLHLRLIPKRASLLCISTVPRS